MTGTTRRTAVAAVAASLGLTGVVLLAAAPMYSASAASRTVAVPDPGGGDGGGMIDGNQPTVDVTTTVTVTAAPTETADPVVTITTTVTPAPTVTRTRTVRPTQSTRADDPPPSAPPTTQQPVIPTHQPVQTTESAPQSQPSESASEPPLTLPSATPSTPEAGSSTPVESSTAFEEPTPDSVAIEIRNASPEYDQIGMSRQLAVPGILLVLLVVFAVFVLQSRLQRVAHAAAVRRAGPHRSGGRRDAPEAGAYPGPAYAPIIGFVPMQPVVMPPAQPGYGVYPPGYPAPGPYGMAQQPGMFQQMPPVQPGPGHAQPQFSPMPPQPDPAAQQAGPAFPPGGPQATPGPAAAEPPGASPQAEPSGGWFTPRTEPPGTPGPASPFRPGGGDPWSRGGDQDAGEATLLLPYGPPPRPALEPGPSAFADPPVETTVSVERIGPDGQPMPQPPARGKDATQQDPGAETGSASDASASEAAEEPDAKDGGRRRWWRS